MNNDNIYIYIYLKNYLAGIIEDVNSQVFIWLKSGFSLADVVLVRPRVHHVIVWIAQVVETLVLLYHESPRGKTNEILAQIKHQAFPRTATCDFANVSVVWCMAKWFNNSFKGHKNVPLVHIRCSVTKPQNWSEAFRLQANIMLRKTSPITSFQAKKK